MDLLFLWICTFVAGFWVCKKIKQWQTQPPGPWGLPIIGYLPFINQQSPHSTFTALAKTYGPIYSVSMGSIYTVVISDHKMIREAFAKDSFSGRAPLFMTQGIMQGNGIIFSEGALWKDQRKLVTTWLKNFGMSKHSVSREKLENRIAAGVLEILENVEKAVDCKVDLHRLLENSLGNVVNDIVFGFKFPADDKTWFWLRHIQEEACHEMGVAGALNFLPFLRFLPSNRKIVDMILRGQEQTHRLYAAMITRRRDMLGFAKPKGAEYQQHEDLLNDHPKGHIKCVKYSKSDLSLEEHYFDPEVLIPTDGECILDNFLKEQKSRFENGDPASQFARDEQLHYLLGDMFGAGLDTTAVTMSWFLLYMALYPEEQHKVRTEILSVCPKDGTVESNRLPYLMAAICETQRIRSIVPVGIPHGCLEDSYIGNYRIPKGTMVMPLHWAIHMDPDVWEEPEEFKPSRFLAEDGSLLKPQEFIPFQTGKRMCPGDELSRMLSCGLISRLFSERRVRLACDPPSEDEMKGKIGVTLTPPRVTYYCEPLSY